MIKSNTKFLRTLFFLIGIVATLAYRMIIFFNLYSPYWVNILWYIGTVGFILYFGHRYNIQKKEAELVEKYKLLKAVEDSKHIKGKQKEALNYIVNSIATSKSRWNSLTIVLLSVLALIM